MPALAKVLRELKVEDALLYLDQVKVAFGDKPEIYNEFLDIMKNFKAQEIDTPGVIRQVSHLFRGYNKLILGFNTFLPDGYKIDLPIDEGENAMMTVHIPNGAHGMSRIETYGPVGHISATSPVQELHVGSLPPQHPPSAGDYPSGDPSSSSAGPPHMGRGGPPPPPPPHHHAPPPPPPPPQSAAAAAAAAAAANSNNPPVEFNHAISYVTTIKKRFAHEPETYKAFLEILHTYQKEQRSIKDVLEQVSQLFADHPDLLKEFTYFLPDAVQEQANERLSRAARESEMRREQQMDMARAGGMPLAGGGGRKGGLMSAQDRGGRRSMGGGHHGTPRGGSGRMMSQLQQQQHHLPQHHHMMPLHDQDGGGGGGMSPSSALAQSKEMQFFNRIKAKLGNEAAWTELVKCFDLFAQDMVQRAEMVELASHVLGKHHLDLFEEFKQVLNARGLLRAAAAARPVVSMDEGDDDQEPPHPSARKTPSYCELTRPFPSSCDPDVCCLNTTIVSVPADNNRYFSSHRYDDSRKDPSHEEEDALFERDMLIESNASTIRALERLEREMDATTAKSKNSSGRLALVDREVFSVVHLNAIARLYGDHTTEIVELLSKNPAVAVPTILKRLRQKDAEWREL